MLGRDPDAEGLSLYSNLLSSNTESLATIEAILAYSPEETNNLTRLVTDVTGTAPTAAAIAADEQELANGTPLTTVVAPLVTEAQGEIAGLYEQVLGRPADAGGLAAYQALVPTLALEGHTPIATIRAAMANSPEAANDLTAFYTNVYGTAPTAAQVSAYQAELASGASLQSVEAGIVSTAISNLYQQVLGRAADTPGLLNYIALFNNGVSLASIEANMAESGEATNDLNSLYQQVLNRPADSGGFSTYQNELENGVSLAAIRANMAVSPEASNDLITAYSASYGAAPSQNVLVFLEAELAQVTGSSATGTTLATIEAALANPLIINTVASQTIDLASTDQPFAEVSVSDPIAGSETATMTLASGNAGVLSGTGVTADGNGVYTVAAASAAALTTALDGVVFTPASPTQPLTTTISLSVTDAASNTGTAATSTITTADLGLPTAARFVYASVGNDTLTGTAITGGTPNAFAFTASTIGADVINNFNISQDFLLLSANTFGSVSAVLAATADNGSGNAVISLGGASTVTLTGISTATLTNHSQDIKLI